MGQGIFEQVTDGSLARKEAHSKELACDSGALQLKISVMALCG